MKYYLIAGELSGDQLGASLINNLKKHDGNAEFRFLGGDEMQKEGNNAPVIHVKEMAFMGFFEVLKNLSKILRFFEKAKQDIKQYNPDCVILIDYPGFNLRMAKWSSKMGYKVIYYVSPSVWAWNQSRVYDIEKYVNLMICILPFELAFYKKYHVNAKYFGNPNVELITNFQKDENFKNKFEITKPILALLPGSRIQEVKLILPEMVIAALSFNDNFDIIIAKANNIPIEIYESIIPSKTNIKIIGGQYKNILAHASMAIVTSGTATLETALFNVPQVVCYKTSWATYQIAKRLVKVKFISLVNLIANRLIVTELIQDDCYSTNIVREINKLIEKNQTDLYKPMFEALEYKGKEEIGQAIINEVKR